MEKVWLKEYPPTVPAEIDPSEYASLRDLIEASLSTHAAREGYVLMDVAMTYAEVDRLSQRFGAWLQNEARLQKGDRVAIMLPNLPQYPIVMFGALRAGMTVVNVNPLYTATELEHQLADAGATVVVALENFCAVLQEALPKTQVRHVIVTAVGDLLGFPKAAIVNFVVRRVRKQVPRWQIASARRLTDLLESTQHELRRVDIAPTDIAFLQYTGGTTGVAKGAMLTHRNMVANVLQCRAWHRQVPIDNAVHIIALPLYHIFSLTANCFLYLSVGGRGILIPNPRDFSAFVKELRKHPPTVFNGVNTLFNALMSTPGFDSVDFSKLIATIGGGMAVQRPVAERWKKLTGCVLTQGWGLTETSPVACVNLLGPHTEYTGSIGLPISSTELSVRDDVGAEVPLGDVGELCVRGPQVMAGYWQRPDETAQVMLPEGWIRTGDIGRMDAKGYVFIEDRKKDMITVSGFKVYPNEVEAVVASHPGVFEAAAVAEADERSGEVVALYVVKKDPALTAEQVIAHAKKSLTGYKVPRKVYFRTELPKTNVGKILRRALREASH